MEKLKEELEELYDDYPEEPARKQALSHQDHWGLTALHYAVKYEHLNVVRMLVENGAGLFDSFNSWFVHQIQIFDFDELRKIIDRSNFYR